MKLLIIDFSSLVHQIPRSAGKLCTSQGLPSGHVFSLLRKILIISTLNPDLVIFCLDAGHDHRDKIEPNYKANRENSTGDMVDDLIPLLNALPVIHCVKRGYEADDLLFTLAKCLHKKFDILLLSKDYDISYNLIFYPRVRHFFTFDQEIQPITLYMRFGCTPRQLPLFKAIFGDSSDNIKGIKLGRDKKRIVNSFADSSTKEIVRGIDKKYYPTILKNLRLIKPKFLTDISVSKGELDKSAIYRYLKRYEIRSLDFHSLVKNFPANKELLTRVFKRLKDV